jgi:hypothetical protein
MGGVSRVFRGGGPVCPELGGGGRGGGGNRDREALWAAAEEKRLEEEERELVSWKGKVGVGALVAP